MHSPDVLTMLKLRGCGRYSLGREWPTLTIEKAIKLIVTVRKWSLLEFIVILLNTKSYIMDGDQKTMAPRMQPNASRQYYHAWG